MAADSHTIELTLLAQSDDTGRMTHFAGGGVRSEVHIDRVRAVTVYFGPSHTPSLAQTASIITLIPQNNSGGSASVFQLYVLEAKDVVLSKINQIKLSMGHGIMSARRPMKVEPMALAAPAPVTPAQAKPAHAPSRVLATTSGGF